ncbi:MAG: class I SAM-dependent methyltransferase [Acidobacteriota bacterium]
MPLPRVLEPEVMSGAEEAGEYDEMDFSATDLLFAERAAQLARGARGPVGLIADLGSGNAKIPLAMCPLLPAPTSVCAIEMSAEMLAVAARNRARDGVSPGQLHLITADVKQVPFAARSVGMVTSNSLVHHIPDPRSVFREIARISRPGGPILIRDLVRPETEGALERLLQAHAARWSPLQRKLFSDSLYAALTLEEVRDILHECGLADVTVTQVSDRHWSAERA